jgi:hypothetical protein
MGHHKNWVTQYNTTFKKDYVIKVADQKLASITAEDCQRRCQHVRNIEQQLMAREGLPDAGRQFVFHVDDSSDSSGGDEEEQAGEKDIYADITGISL